MPRSKRRRGQHAHRQRDLDWRVWLRGFPVAMGKLERLEVGSAEEAKIRCLAGALGEALHACENAIIDGMLRIVIEPEQATNLRNHLLPPRQLTPGTLERLRTSVP